MKKPDGNAVGAKLKSSYKTRNWRVGSYSVLAALIVVAIAVVVNMVVGALPSSTTQLDMTPEQLYSISGQTEQILAGLNKEVDVYWIVQEGREDAALQQLLSRYAEYSSVKVTSVDPVKYPNFASAYTDETVANNSLVVSCGDRSMFIASSDIWTYSDYEQYQYYYYNYGQEYLDTFAGEQQITSAVSYVTSDDLPVMYVLGGHGETALSDAVSSAVALENVQIESLSLLTVEAVPDDCALLCIAGPASDISADELAMLRAYAERGGKLLVTLAYTEENMPNLSALLADWGMGLDYGYVLENDSDSYMYGYVDLLLPSLQSHCITSPLSESGYSVLFPDSVALRLLDNVPDAVSVSSLLKSSSTAYLKVGLSGLTEFDQTDDDPTGPFVLAAAATNRETGGMMVVFGSHVFMESSYSDMVSGANLDLFLNSVDWLCEKDDSIAIHPKTLMNDVMSFSDSAASLVKLVLIVVIPLAFIAAGVIVYIRRRRR